MTKEVLYYPTIEFVDEAWLKASLCFWDKIYRIVPSGYTPNDSDEVKVAVENNLVANININEIDLIKTAEKFELFLNQATIVPAAVIGWENIDVKLHPDKVDARILPILESMAKKFTPDGFLSISQEVASIYMLFLADVISKRRQISKLTDNDDMFAIMHYFANNANIDEWIYNKESAEVTSYLVFLTIFPKGIEYMPIEKVINFRKKTIYCRANFRHSIDKLIAELCKIEDINFQKDKINEFQNEIEKNNREMLNQIGKKIHDFGYSLLTIGLPTTISAISFLSGGNNTFGLTQIGSSCFIGVVSSLADAMRSKRKNWKSSDTFYYYQLKKTFGNENQSRVRIPRFDRIFEEFIND